MIQNNKFKSTENSFSLFNLIFNLGFLTLFIKYHLNTCIAFPTSKCRKENHAKLKQSILLKDNVITDKDGKGTH